MKQLLLLIFISLSLNTLYSQDVPVFQTFHDTRVISVHSVETLPKGKMDFRIAHRFGDMFGDAGGWPTFYGLENASDVLIGFEYGVSDKFMIGLNRAKGAGLLRSNVNFLGKYRLIEQEKPGNQPVSVTVVAMGSFSSMEKSPTEGVLHFFEKRIHRLSYHGGIHVARKFSNRLALQLNATLTYRNIVPSNDQNAIPALGGAMRYQATKGMGLLLDFTYPFSTLRSNKDLVDSEKFYIPLGFGIEFDTGGGHVFQINFTNSKGLIETDYIPYTQSKWLDGEFRLGFTISRLFTL